MSSVSSSAPHRLPGFFDGPRMPAKATIKQAELPEFAAARKAARRGIAPAEGMPRTFMERVRDWSVEHPRVSTGIALATIGAIATSMALAAGWAVDELAHLTNRKNDRVGEVVGAFVGIAVAFTQTVSLFGGWRRFEMRYKAGAWRPDSKTPEGQSLRLIDVRAKPLLVAMKENAKSEIGFEVSKLEIKPHHVRDTLNEIAAERLSKDQWCIDPENVGAHNAHGYLLDRGMNAPATDRPSFVADRTVAKSGIVAGHRYESLYRSTNDILDQDLRRKNFTGTNDKLRDVVAGAKAHIHAKHGAEKPLPRGSALDEPGFRTLSPEKQRALLDGLARYADAQELKEKDYALYFKALKIFDPSSDPKHGDEALFKALPRTFIRIDEDTKIGPALSGLRPPTLHGLLVGFKEAFSATFTSASNAENQGRSVGAVLLSYLPMTMIASVLSVLCLGMSSTSTPGGAKIGRSGAPDPPSAPLGEAPAYKHAHAASQSSTNGSSQVYA